MSELLTRFLIGGTIVAAFAVLGDVFKPRSFAGLFGAAPSVALATLGLTIARNGREYAAIECRSMLIGALALGVYSAVVCFLLARGQAQTLPTTLASVVVWFAVTFGAWCFLLR